MTINKPQASLAGWPLRTFSLKELTDYLSVRSPLLLELSKDQLMNTVSTKGTYKAIKEYTSDSKLRVSYAGTTDFVDCAGFSFETYRRYLQIQASQARFLESDQFRVMVGGDAVSDADVVHRLGEFDEILGTTEIVIEFHGGWESNIQNIRTLVEETDYGFVVDFHNLLEAGLSFSSVTDLVPSERIAYFHTRNLPPKYVEHQASLAEEEAWTESIPETEVLWEPKTIDKQEVMEVIT